MSIRTSPDLILCMTFEDEHETVKKTMATSASFISEHIGQRYDHIIRKKEDLAAGGKGQSADRT